MKNDIIRSFLDLRSPLKERIEYIYLLGSRARNDWKPDSDYDILVVVDKRDGEIVDKLYDEVIEILLNTGALVSLKIFPLSEFNRLKSLKTPFIENVLKDGGKTWIQPLKSY